MNDVVAPALAKLEAEIGVVLDERREELVHAVTRVLIAMALEEHYGRENGNSASLKVCVACGERAAARHRTICHSCRGKARRRKEQLAKQAADELEAAARGLRGPRAQELVLGRRTLVGRVGVENGTG